MKIKKLSVMLILLLLGTLSASSAGPWRLGVAMDLFKTDFASPAAKTQIGIEANYFFMRNFSATGGYEMWTNGGNSIILGTRFYPINPVFVRFRGLIKDNSDLSLGAGYVNSLTKNWKLDIIGDYYFNEGELGIRMGIAYLF